MNIIKTILLIFALTIVTPGKAQKVNHTFTLGDSTFLLDGKPFQMISGELHYTRIPKEAWRHRMKMAKAMGLNTIGTYVFWNVHEPEKGVFDFSGNNDIAAFVKIAQEEGLWVILRPSPYVCAEWEFGGYPYWLQKDPALIVRSTEPTFLTAYKNYIKELARHLATLQINRGGNILMIQVENEYGFYSNDKTYLEESRRILVEAGFDGLLYTCDPAAKVGDGYIPGLLPAINGLTSPEKIKSLVRKYHNGKGPFYIAEWYPAWFDWWGRSHHTVPAKKYTDQLDSILAAGISINMYMFHGGTTRDFMNGANVNDTVPYEPQISSYDYDAPLDEAGNVTDKYLAFRNVIEKHLSKDSKLPPIPARKKSAALPDIKMNETASIFNILNTPVKNAQPLTFEDLDQAYGFVLYRTQLVSNKPAYLKINELRDYALIFLNGKRYGIVDRRLYQDSLLLDIPNGNYQLDILVENLGRVNFGPALLKNKKGITESVTFNNVELTDWQMFKLPFTNVEKVKYTEEKIKENTPVIRRGFFKMTSTSDTYFNLSDWGKGVVWVNGHNLGRYWYVGPQQTIYVPAEWLKSGINEVVIFELIKSDQSVLKSSAKPILDSIHTERNSP